MTVKQRRKVLGRPTVRNRNRFVYPEGYLVRKHEEAIGEIIRILVKMLPVLKNLNLFGKVTARHIQNIENRLDKKGI